MASDPVSVEEVIARAIYDGPMMDPEEAEELARVVLRALEAAGLVVVPREPTQEILETVCASMDRPDWEVHARQAWSAAVDAALFAALKESDHD